MMKINSLTLFIAITYIIYLPIIFAQSTVEVGIDERLGDYLPQEAVFVTSENDTIKIKDILGEPLLLALVYYECPGICSPMLNELTWTIDKLQLEPGEDYKIVTVSFDPRENFQTAAKWKRNYLHSIKRKFKNSDWLFLTGDSANIKKLTDALGFYYKKSKDDQYIHAGTIIAVSPEGKISRYLFGSSFNPFDVKMALIDAKAGKTNPTITKVLEFCFSYDPEGRQYTLNVTRIVGTVMLLGLGIFVVVFVLKKKKPNLQ